MENLTGGTPPVRYLPCVVPCKQYFDEVETTKENEANFLGVDYESMFPGECQKYRWSKFKNLGSAEEMYELV